MARQKSPRMRKVNELVREVVADAVVDLKDPRIGFLTITGARTSPDLRHAVVYYSVMGTDDEKAGTAEALARATPRIQSVLGSETRLRYTPKLTFEVDPSIDEGIRISQILSDLADESDTEIDEAHEDGDEAVDDA
ncbi:MAG: 30S ribosome-binding factor RbfA [Acidimicrobiia bacterium]